MTHRSSACRPVFGNVRLGYVVIESRRFADWRRFAEDAVGMHCDEIDRDTLRFRLDENPCRFLVRRGPAEDVTALGWEADDHDTFDRVIERVTASGVPVLDGTEQDAAQRGATRLMRFPGPKGIVQEVFTTARTDAPLRIRYGNFVTGPGGLGHVAVTSTKPDALQAFYSTVFDARLSDFIEETISGMKMKIRFLRVNERHHSVAIANVRRLPIDPIRTRVQHVNVQVADLDSMVSAYQRATALGFGMALGIGQHTNDRELSFYAMTPSGFEWEVGWNPIVVDETTWEPTTHQGISIWGHTRAGQTVVDKLGQLKYAAASLTRREETVATRSGRGCVRSASQNTPN